MFMDDNIKDVAKKIMKEHEVTFLKLRISELEDQLISKEKLLSVWEEVNGIHYSQYINPVLKRLFP